MNSKEKSRKHFNDTAQDYNKSSDGQFVEPMYEVLVDEIEKSESARILDVGCGNGNLFNLLSDGKYELFGIDFSENMVGEARKNCKNASFSLADAENLPFENDSFDIVVCNASFHHYVHPEAVLSEMHRVLKDGGKLLIGDPYVPGFARPFVNVLVRFSDKGDYHFYGLKEMKNLFASNGFNPVSSKRTAEHAAFHVAVKA